MSGATDWLIARWTRVAAIVSAVIALATIVTGVVAYLQWQALLQTDETTRKLQRAFVWSEPFDYRKKPDGSGNWELFVRLRNSSTSAAEHSRRENGICWSTDGSFGSKFEYPVTYPPLTSASPGDEKLKAFGLRCLTHIPPGWPAVLPAQQSIDNGAATLPIHNSDPQRSDEDATGLAKEFAQQKSAKTKYLFVFGRVRYDDVFGKQHYAEDLL